MNRECDISRNVARYLGVADIKNKVTEEKNIDLQSGSQGNEFRP